MSVLCSLLLLVGVKQEIPSFVQSHGNWHMIGYEYRGGFFQKLKITIYPHRHNNGVIILTSFIKALGICG